MEEGVASGLVVRDLDGRVYTGFLQWKNVMESKCRFESMSSNRAINDDVVDERVRHNLKELTRSGRFCEFGQINLLILLNSTTHNFYVMDGQHRVRVMEKLYKETGKDIRFQFRAKAVSDDAEAHQELLHFQNSYPSDPRSFFSAKHAREVSTSVLLRLRTEFPSNELWVQVQTSRAGKRCGDPNRPKLNDFLVFWFLQDSSLLRDDCTDAQVFQHVVKMNRLMKHLSQTDSSKLGKGVTQNMIRSASRWGCFLGFFREEALHWHDLNGQLGNLPADTASEAAQSREDRDSLACVICMDAARNTVLQPQFLEARGKMNDKLVEIINRVYTEPHDTLDSLKRMMKDHLHNNSSAWNDQVDYLVGRMAEIGDKAQNQRPDSVRVRRARGDQAPAQVDLDSRCKWYTGTLHLMVRKMYEDQKEEPEKVEAIGKAVDKSLKEFKDLVEDLERRLKSTINLEDEVRQAVGHNDWLAEDLNVLVHKEVRHTTAGEEKQVWEDLKSELSFMLEVHDEQSRERMKRACKLDDLLRIVKEEVEKQRADLLGDDSDGSSSS
ncbi:unnamed protein product, partial [Symbiodinium necroappetens]